MEKRRIRNLRVKLAKKLSKHFSEKATEIEESPVIGDKLKSLTKTVKTTTLNVLDTSPVDIGKSVKAKSVHFKNKVVAAYAAAKAATEFIDVLESEDEDAVKHMFDDMNEVFGKDTDIIEQINS